jgi:hypothetical protein
MLWSNSCPFLTFITFPSKILIDIVSFHAFIYNTFFNPWMVAFLKPVPHLFHLHQHSHWFTFLSDFWRLRKLVFYSSLDKDSIAQKAELENGHMLDITEHTRNFLGEQNLQAFWPHNEKFNKLRHVSSVRVGLLEDLKTERIILTCKEKQIHWQNNDI